MSLPQYKIFIQRRVGNSWVADRQAPMGGSTATIMTGLARQTQYRWYVNARMAQEDIWVNSGWAFFTTIAGDPEIISPAPGSRLAGSNVTFEWTANGHPVTRWWLYVGNSPGARDIFNSGSLGTALSVAVPSLPTDGRVVYVRLWFTIGGSWERADFVYTAARGFRRFP